jgi:hypothetical protein
MTPSNVTNLLSNASGAMIPEAQIIEALIAH